MANQPKSVSQLESELQATLDAAKKIEKDLAEARKAEAEKVARLKAAVERRERKARIAKRAEFDILSIDYEDVITPVKPAKSVTDFKPVSVQQSTTPASKQETTKTPKSLVERIWDSI